MAGEGGGGGTEVLPAPELPEWCFEEEEEDSGEEDGQVGGEKGGGKGGRGGRLKRKELTIEVSPPNWCWRWCVTAGYCPLFSKHGLQSVWLE